MSKSGDDKAASDIESLIQEKSGLLLEAQLKAFDYPEEARRLYGQVAAQEERIADLFISQHRTQDALVNLISAASCWKEAGDHDHAYQSLNRARAIPEHSKAVYQEIREIDRSIKRASRYPNRKSTAKRLVPAAAVLILVLAAFVMYYSLVETAGFANAWAIPVSTRVLTTRFTMPDGNWFELSQLEGSLIKIRKDDSGQTFGLALRSTQNQGDFELAVVSISRIADQGEGVQAIRSFSIEGGTRLISLLPSLTVQVSVRLKDGLEPMSTIVEDECCVTCGGFTFCGCKVESSCGSCCMRPCC
jgi:hypothetical protein